MPIEETSLDQLYGSRWLRSLVDGDVVCGVKKASISTAKFCLSQLGYPLQGWSCGLIRRASMTFAQVPQAAMCGSVSANMAAFPAFWIRLYDILLYD
jgi:hypothetical protein